MARFIEGAPLHDPVTAFDAAIAKRHQEVLLLSGGLRGGLDLVRNQGRVNELLLASSRPDLVMTARAEVMLIHSPEDVGNVNNFIPNMRGFGMPVYAVKENRWRGIGESKIVGLRDFTPEERAQAFLIGGRGNRNEHQAFAAENGIDWDFAEAMFTQTHLKREAFMRMWILMPKFTEELMDTCLDRPNGKHFRKIEEELFVAYSLMSRLVDRKDNGALKTNGSVDVGLLLH